MKYENGKDIFPEKLLKQIQKYVSGQLVYIPSAEKKKDWGETTGYREYLLKRNNDIKMKFRNGVTIKQLSDEYCLSYETIKKIAYSKKEVFVMEYKNTLSSAINFARNGKLEKWVHMYLQSDGHNQEFSDGLKLLDRYFLGPVKMPLSLFKRCCGPEEGMKWQIPKEGFEQKVKELEAVIATVEDMPPLIVHFVEGEFELNDGNHRLEAYSRLGVEEYYVIVWITEKEEYAMFMDLYSEYLQ
ncbi:MAG: ParB-like nuclease domain-containing protein [Lachnospiraceae bacterium]|nr:ParB-like nuclease domain-containing protein [Lachnospiraceae bacterium]